MTQHKQHGFSLVIVLLILTALSLLAVAGYTIVTSSSRSATTWNDRQRSLYLTESALGVAETEINTWINTTGFPPNNVDYFKKRSVAPSNLTPFPSTNIRSVDIESGNNKVANGQVHYFVVWETESGKLNNKERVTVYAQSAGARSDSNTVVSATYEFE